MIHELFYPGLMQPVKSDFFSLANDMSVHPGCSLAYTVDIIFYLPMYDLSFN